MFRFERIHYSISLSLWFSVSQIMKSVWRCLLFVVRCARATRLRPRAEMRERENSFWICKSTYYINHDLERARHRKCRCGARPAIELFEREGPLAKSTAVSTAHTTFQGVAFSLSNGLLSCPKCRAERQIQMPSLKVSGESWKSVKINHIVTIGNFNQDQRLISNCTKYFDIQKISNKGGGGGGWN
jgi:hypothetical protein